MKNFCRIIFVALLAATSLNIQAQQRAADQEELRSWKFSKDRTNWQEVSVPHSCNALDGHSQSYYRGKAYYKKTLTFSKADLKRPIYLLFEGAAQTATVSVNGKQIAEHKGGYTPFVVTLSKNIHEGNNEVEVCTDNILDVNLAPVSSDFNKNNGLHNPVYLLRGSVVSFLPERYGMYRMHVSTPFVSREKATGKAQTFIVNTSGKKQKFSVRFRLETSNGAKVYESERAITLENAKGYDYAEDFYIQNPHLWDGLNDPYLYTAKLSIVNSKDKEIDRAETKVGFRFYQITANDGFFLNGRSYPLHGVSEHQDWDGQASAVTKDNTYKDYEIIHELGANFLRLAHYPHNDYEFRLCDSLGIIVQTEIPWVNVCGVNAKKEYFDNLDQQMREMVVNLYNHPSIVFWGIFNEVDQWGNNDKLQGKFDAEKIINEVSRLYRIAKAIDPYRYTGLTDCSIFRNKGYTSLAGDFFSENRYPDWYQMNGGPNALTNVMKEVRNKMGRACIAEYGGGVNPFCHTLDSTMMKDRSDDSKHYEEYGCYLHENSVRQILQMPWLNFTSLWILFDFPVADRKEGYIDSPDGMNFTANEKRKYMNDKGLVTRNRKVKKDHFYLYKALWNKNVETVYITGRRRSGSHKDSPFNVKVYSNSNSLSLYQNGELVEKLEKCPSPTGVIWTFKPIKYKTSSDTFKVVSDTGASDEVEWKAL